MANKLILILDEKNSHTIYNEPAKTFATFGIDCEAWEFRKMNPKFTGSNPQVLNNPLNLVHHDIRSRAEFERLLDALILSGNKIMFFTGTVILPWNKFIFETLKKKNIPYALARRRTHPLNLFKKIYFIKPEKFSKLLDYYFVKLQRPFQRLYKLAYKIYKYKGKSLKKGVSAPALTFFGTDSDRELMQSSFPLTKKNTFYIHHGDYDNYLEDLDKPLAEDIDEEMPYALFIDQYYPYHPETLSHSINIDATDYYGRLENFFVQMEKAFGKKVLIAAHPISDLDLLKKHFPQRSVFKLRTQELIKNAGYVFTHVSTAVSWAVVCNKPFFMVTSQLVMEFPLLGRQIEGFSTIWNKTPVYIEDFDKYKDYISKEISSYNKQYYKAYMNNFIKKEGTPQMKFWEFTGQKLKEYFETYSPVSK